MSKILKVNPYETSIGFVREGSTIISGTVVAYSVSSAQSPQSSMSSLSSNSLNGFPILSSTAIIYYGNQADVEKIEKYPLSKASRTGLIIGYNCDNCGSDYLQNCME